MHNNSNIACKSFCGTNGETEHFISIQAPEGASFEDQLKAVETLYASSLKSLGLAPDTAVFRRVFLSDVLNQKDIVHQSSLFADPASPVAVSIVQQQPLPGSKIALMAYHIQGGTPLIKQRLTPNQTIVQKNGLRHLWSTGFCAGASINDNASTSETQTRTIFNTLIDTLTSQGSNLRDHCVRTWIYMKNVDVFYQGMVDARRELFIRQGLTGDTHYIASTGIEGACGQQFDVVAMDAYSILGLKPQQMSYLNDFDRLCPTKDYKVTFERGTRIAYADRAHHFISGTASIDNAGNILHPGDVLRQTERTFENIDALLKSGKAKLSDMMHMIVYLRDPADFSRVNSYIKANFPDIPHVIVQGAVCRPGWLIEVEGIAAAKNNEPSLPSF